MITAELTATKAAALAEAKKYDELLKGLRASVEERFKSLQVGVVGRTGVALALPITACHRLPPLVTACHCLSLLPLTPCSTQGELKQAKEECDRLRAERNKLHIAQREHETKNAWGAAQELVIQLTARNSLLQRQWQRVLALQSKWEGWSRLGTAKDWRLSKTRDWERLETC